MPYQTMTITNLPLECGIQIACVKTGTEPGDVTKVLLKRKLHSGSTWVTIWEKTISTVDDFTFTVKDFNTKSRYTYDYAAVPCEGTTELDADIVTDNNKCEFDGIYIADDTATYICVLNPKCPPPEPYGEDALVVPLGATYPFLVNNASADFVSGTVTGLFLPVPSSGNYTQEATQTSEARDYKDAVLTFLKNGKNKTLKTWHGFMWNVGIRRGAKEIEGVGEADGASEITFNWVELGAPPSTGVVVAT